MGIRGGASSDGYLVWYEARSAADLPRGWSLTVPLWVWHVLMLVWSLWVARMFIRWARWGWAQMQQGGFWRRG
jgi:membrane protein YdbS with pleckstrin-like domain